MYIYMYMTRRLLCPAPRVIQILLLFPLRFLLSVLQAALPAPLPPRCLLLSFLLLFPAQRLPAQAMPTFPLPATLLPLLLCFRLLLSMMLWYFQVSYQRLSRFRLSTLFPHFPRCIPMLCILFHHCLLSVSPAQARLHTLNFPFLPALGSLRLPIQRLRILFLIPPSPPLHPAPRSLLPGPVSCFLY